MKVEYIVVDVDRKEKVARLALRAHDVLTVLMEEEKTNPK